MQAACRGVMFGATLLAASLPFTVAYGAQPFDGQWSVEVVTEKGTCDTAYRWDLQIADGRVASTPDMPAAASGSVSSKGVVAVRFTRGADAMNATGSAAGKWASGNWSAPSKNCSGRWRAERRA